MGAQAPRIGQITEGLGTIDEEIFKNLKLTESVLDITMPALTRPPTSPSCGSLSPRRCSRQDGPGRIAALSAASPASRSPAWSPTRWPSGCGTKRGRGTFWCPPPAGRDACPRRTLCHLAMRPAPRHSPWAPDWRTPRWAPSRWSACRPWASSRATLMALARARMSVRMTNPKMRVSGGGGSCGGDDGD